MDKRSARPARERRGRLGRVAALVVRHPRKVVATWMALVAVLAAIGLGLEDELSVEAPRVEGSAAARAHSMSIEEFGRDNALIVLLRGPRQAVERQGRLLERRLDAMPDTLVVSPWTSGSSIEGLMPRAGAAGIVVNTENPDAGDVTAFLPPLRERVEETIRPPVRSSIAGAPAIRESFLEASKQAAFDGERIAVPLLLIVLLLVFRSVAAAAVPVAIGGAVVGATRGVLDLLLAFTELNFLALGAIGMIGLALGVDYSLLVVSRFREETAKGAEPAEAALRTIPAVGPTVAMAGTGLALAMLAAWQLIPGAVIGSVSIAVMVAAVLSVLSALFVTPAILLLLGPRLERWALPQRGGHGFTAAWTSRLSRRPRLVVLPAIAFMVASALWAFTLDTEVEAVSLLPAGHAGREQQEDVQRVLGPGWLAPYEILMDGGRRPVTTPRRLEALAAFQRRIERDPGIATMTGFAPIERATRQLGGLEDSLVEQRRGLARLSRGLSRVHDGAARGTEGLLDAAEGARRLDSAVGATHDGAGLLAEGLATAGGGAERLAGGLDRASGGSDRLASGTEKASAGAQRLSSGLSQAAEQADEIVSSARLMESAMTRGEERVAEIEGSIAAIEAQLGATLTALSEMTVGRDDPQYARALEAAESASASVGGAADGASGAAGQFSLGLYLAERQDKAGRKASDGVAELARGSERLDRGLDGLAEGSRKVSDGIARLSEGGQALSPGLLRLGTGCERLGDGLGQIGDGTAGLAGGLGGGAQRSKLLTGALDKIGGGVDRSREQSGESSSALEKRSPHLFRSGYFYLASIDGSSPERRSRAGLLISLDRGGHAARMLVIPRYSHTDDRAAETRERVEAEAERLAERTGSDVLVGGATPEQLDLETAFRDQSGPARLAMALITVLVLILMMRSLIVPFIAALLNLLTVAASFGLLALLFNDALLGGPGFVDASVIPITIVVILALAIDYEVFIFARMREEYERSGSPQAAIRDGLDRTAPVITGAALIMIMVFFAFSLSPFITIRSFGVAQAIAVAIDAFIVRLVIVPAVMRALGPWAWWMPRWLDRLLPGATLKPRREVA
jgi:putative drug exporter of the RND superfamily